MLFLKLKNKHNENVFYTSKTKKYGRVNQLMYLLLKYIFKFLNFLKNKIFFYFQKNILKIKLKTFNNVYFSLWKDPLAWTNYDIDWV